MDLNGWTLFVAVVAAAIAAAAWFTSWGTANKANNTAEEAKGIADRANQIARESVGEAQDANRLTREALEQARAQRMYDLWSVYHESLTSLMAVEFWKSADWERILQTAYASLTRLSGQLEGDAKRWVETDWEIVQTLGAQAESGLATPGLDFDKARAKADEMMKDALAKIMNNVRKYRDGEVGPSELLGMLNNSQEYLTALQRVGRTNSEAG